MRHVPLLLRPPSRRHDRRLGHLRRYEAEELVELGREAGLEVTSVRFTGHPVTVLQVGLQKLPTARPVGAGADRLWWWCEARDLRASDRPRGSMQLHVLFERPA